MSSLGRRSKRSAIPEFIAPESPSHQSAESTLPKLPTKAKARFDHLGFREQGSRVAKDRIDALEKKTSSLFESEEQLTKERGSLLISAKKELGDALRRQHSIGRVRTHDCPQDLFRDVKLQYDETVSALEIEIEKGAVQEGLLISDDKISKNATESKRRKLDKRMRSQKEKKQRRQSVYEQIQDLERELGRWKEDQENDVDEHEDPRSPTKFNEDHDKKSHNDEHHPKEDHDVEDHDVEDHDAEDHDAEDHNAEDHNAEDHNAEDHDVEDHDVEDHDAENHDEDYDEDDEEDEKEDQNKDEKQKKDSFEGKHGEERKRKLDTKQIEEERNKQRGRLDEQGKELRAMNEKKLHKDLRQKRMKMKRYDEAILKLDEEIELLRSKLDNLDKEDTNDDTETPSENDHPGEQDLKEKRQKDHEENQYLKRQDERERRLRRVKREVHAEKRWQRLLRRNKVRRRNRTYPDLYYSDSTSGDSDFEFMPDDSDSEETETDDSMLFNTLDAVISHTEVLELQIWKIQEHRKKLSHVVDLKTVLLAETRLERMWLEHLEGHGTIPGNKSSTSQHGHLSGRPITDKEVYKPLNDDQFRVLILFPAPEKHFPLICALETWSTKDLQGSKETPRREYAALSYFWGSDTCNGRIYLVPSPEEGPDTFNQDWGYVAKRATEIRIRNSLFRALLRLRKDGPNAHPVALWVDSMCINQNDLVEKTEQLARMVNIYSKASNVCIWLGESDSRKRSDEAMEFISTIMDFAVLDRHAKDKKQAKKWYALGELMRDRWFSRRWVVQEIALAKDATVHCGGAIVRWSDFADAASLLVSNQETIKSLFDFSEWREGPNTLGDVQSFGASILLEATNNLFLRKHNGELKRPTKNIESLVTSLKTFDTSNPRDLIYSLVCIASDTKVGPWASDPNDKLAKGLEKFKMNYNDPVVDVYKYFTKFCVSSSGSLDIICRPWAMPPKDSDSPRESDSLPSWIPLLSTSEFGEPEEVYSGRKNGEVLVGQAGQQTYRASGLEQYNVLDRQSSAAHIKESGAGVQDIHSSTDDKGILSARGFKLATIDAISPRNTGGVILRESLEMGGWTGIKRNPNSVPDPIWRTLVADRDQDGQFPPSWYQRACLRCLEIADTFNNGDLNVGELLQGHSDMLRKYLTRVRNVTWNRRFFRATVLEPKTEKSDGVQDDKQSILFGLCPPKSKEGDLIYILYGCSVPVVL